MEKKDYNITIIGAGLSGLIAATVLENHGYHPTIYEAESHVGGRLRTFEVEGYRLDRGFQVMLSEYPKIRQYLDLDALKLQKLNPGAVVYEQGEHSRIGDPTRDLSALFPTIFSGIASLSDKYKVLQLHLELKKSTLRKIFTREETTTLEYLQEKGFSEKIIQKFFRPFFAGIFLEPHLKTSSRMFEFVFKMFGEGDAVIPKNGIGAIPLQLYKNLKNTSVHFNTRISKVDGEKMTLENGEQVHSQFYIIANSGEAISQNKPKIVNWKSCECLYFTVENEVHKKATIGLQANGSKLINNIFYHSSIPNNNSASGHLLSATIVRSVNDMEKDLVNRVEKELQEEFGIKTIKFLKRFSIPMALPELDTLQYELEPAQSRIDEHIFLAGDHLLNGSQNAAMQSGEQAALGVIAAIEAS